MGPQIVVADQRQASSKVRAATKESAVMRQATSSLPCGGLGDGRLLSRNRFGRHSPAAAEAHCTCKKCKLGSKTDQEQTYEKGKCRLYDANNPKRGGRPALPPVLQPAHTRTTTDQPLRDLLLRCQGQGSKLSSGGDTLTDLLSQ